MAPRNAPRAVHTERAPIASAVEPTQTSLRHSDRSGLADLLSEYLAYADDFEQIGPPERAEK